MSINEHKTVILRSLMQQAEIPSFRALSRVAGVSEWQVEQLRRGKAAQMRVEVLARLSQALKISLAELIQAFAELPPEMTVSANPAIADSLPVSDSLRQEYDRLQAQLERQADELQRSFQQATLQILESWLIQFPSLVYAAQQNPQFPAKNFLVFMRPIEQLMQAWGIESIAAVGTEVPYDPQLHQLMKGTAQAGDWVRVRFTGYRQGETLLYRAKVSPA